MYQCDFLYPIKGIQYFFGPGKDDLVKAVNSTFDVATDPVTKRVVNNMKSMQSGIDIEEINLEAYFMTSNGNIYKFIEKGNYELISKFD
jgi:hypothetical protein